MSYRFPPALAGVLMAVVLVPSLATAGNNAGGRAFLSWDRAGTDTVLTEIPAAPFPLYLHLRGTPDVQALAARIIWTTHTEGTPPCYALISASTPDPAPAPDSLRGWAFDTPSDQDFDGDTTYTWTISFDSEDAGRNCVEYRVSGVACDDTAHAEFMAASVMVMDVLGRIDTLLVTGEAWIAPRVISLAVEQVSPRRVPVQHATDLTIAGRGFRPGSRVFLQRGGQRVEAEQVAVADSTELVARVVSPFSGGDSLDLVVEHPVGLEASLNSSLQATGTTQGTFYRPTNDDFAFTQVPLHATTREQNSYLQDPISHPEWPSWLDSPNLLVVRAPGDTAAVIGSYPKNGLGFVYDRSQGNTPSWVRLYLDPPRLATSLATLVTSGLTFHDASVDEFNDTGKPILRLQVNYEDGDTTIAHLVVGTHVRNWKSGQMWCSGMRPYFDTRPTDTLVAQVYSGIGATGDPPPTVHYDLQEVRLPTERRAKRITSIELLAEPVYHTCGNYLDGTSALCGLAVWPKFRAVSAGGDSVELQRQDSLSWRDAAYGGYAYNDTLVGQHGTVGGLGCLLTCLSMANNFNGVLCTPATLNQYLQSRPRGDGYLWAPVCRVTYVIGDTVAFDVVDTTATVGPTFLIQDGYMSPRATVGVKHIDASGKSGWGVVTERFRGGQVNKGDRGGVFADVNVTAASFGFSTGRWNVTGFGRLATAALVESTLAANSLALLCTTIDAVGTVHWAVADGWEPAFVSGSEARGTYDIKDPTLVDLSSAPLSRLLQAPGGNVFRDALACPLTTSQGDYLVTSSASTADTAGLFLRLQGDGMVSLQDPGGSTIAYDANVGGYVVEVANAIALRRHRLVDRSDPSVSTGTSDLIQIDGAPSGSYLVAVSGGNGGSFTLSADALGGTGATSQVSVSGSLADGPQLYRLQYAPTTVSMTDVTAVGPQGPDALGVAFSVRPNPVTGTADLSFNMGRPATVELAIFDVQGRRVATVLSGTRGAGGVSARWDGRSMDGSRVGAGVYLARLVLDGRATVKRMVVLR